MTASAPESTHAAPEGFSHEALFYAGPADFADRAAAFVRAGLSAGERVLVMVTADKIELLRAALGEAAGEVEFVDMAEAGRNPGRIISAWADFAAAHLGAGRRVRGIGEPIWAARSAEELVECQQHESLINVAFEDAGGFRLLCPYDTTALPPQVIEEAGRSHPLVLDGSELSASASYRHDHAHTLHGGRLPPPPAPSLEVAFEEANLDVLRYFVAQRAEEAGLGARKTENLVLAVHEAATNSIRHGGGGGSARVWTGDGAFVCEVRDRGRIEHPVTGRLRPDRFGSGGHGIWLAHQLCDLVQIRSSRRGTVVRMHVRPDPASQRAESD